MATIIYDTLLQLHYIIYIVCLLRMINKSNNMYNVHMCVVLFLWITICVYAFPSFEKHNMIFQKVPNGKAYGKTYIQSTMVL